MIKVHFKGIKRWFYVEITGVCLVYTTYCYVFKDFAVVTYFIESSIKFLKDRLVLHTTPPICPECGGSMTGVKGNGSPKKLLPGYLDDNFWRERNGKEGPTVSDSILIRIASERC